MSEELKKSNRIALFALLVSLAFFILNILIIFKVFDKSKIEVLISNKINLDLNWGNVGLLANMHFHNTGSKSAFITSIEGLLESVGNEPFRSLITCNMVVTPTNEYEFLGVNIDQQASSPATILIAENFNSTDDQIIQTYWRKKSSEYNTQRLKMSKDSLPIIVSDSLKQELDTFIRSKMSKFKSGRYRFYLKIFVDNDTKSPVIIAREFSIDQSAIDELIEYKKQYHHFYASYPQIRPSVPVTIYTMSKTDEKNLEEHYNNLKKDIH